MFWIPPPSLRTFVIGPAPTPRSYIHAPSAAGSIGDSSCSAVLMDHFLVGLVCGGQRRRPYRFDGASGRAGRCDAVPMFGGDVDHLAVQQAELHAHRTSVDLDGPKGAGQLAAVVGARDAHAQR